MVYPAQVKRVFHGGPLAGRVDWRWKCRLPIGETALMHLKSVKHGDVAVYESKQICTGDEDVLELHYVRSYQPFRRPTFPLLDKGHKP